MKCAACQLFSMRNAGEIAKHAYGNCKREKPYEYRSATPEHECQWFAAEQQEKVQERLEYVEKQQEKFRKAVLHGNERAGG